MSDVLTHVSESGLLTPASQQVVGELALAATFADSETREALLDEINQTLDGSGLQMVDTDAAIEAGFTKTEAAVELSPHAFAGAIRKFYELPDKERRLLRVLSNRAGHGGKIVNGQGAPLFPRAYHSLRPY